MSKLFGGQRGTPPTRFTFARTAMAAPSPHVGVAQVEGVTNSAVSPAARSTPLLVAIPRVVCQSPEPEVRRVHARRVVAGVQSKEAVRNGAEVQFPADPGRGSRSSIYGYGATPVAGCRPRPQPTTVLGRFLNACPETFGERPDPMPLHACATANGALHWPATIKAVGRHPRARSTHSTQYARASHVDTHGGRRAPGPNIDDQRQRPHNVRACDTVKACANSPARSYQ